MCIRDRYCTVSDIRKVDVMMPGMNPQKDRWIEISPLRQNVTPPDWDIRNNRFDDVLVVNNPAEGLWRFRTYYYPNNCIGLAAETGAEDGAEAGAVIAGADQAVTADQVQEGEAVNNGCLLYTSRCV